jgi:Outer membrane protein beta-barrel family/Carboxypeptidase regulatory-like domain/TonB-dependent Receptor Plug Domain
MLRSQLSRVLSAALLTTLGTSAMGQNAQGGGEIRGQLVNAASKAPLPGAPVDISRQGQTTSAARAVTATDGNFRVSGLAPGRYRVRVRALGFGPKDLPAEITTTSPSVNLGTIALTAAPVELKSMEVTGRRQEVQFAPDRSTYVVRDMPTTRGGTALDVLRNIPSVDVDIDNIVSLRGNSAVTVQINGRPSPLKPQQLGNFLSTVSADMVEKIEIIPNPSARDDPTGVAGIINIMLRQKADAGTNGALTLTGGTTGQANVGGNVGYDAEPWSLFASYGFLRDRRPRHDGVYRENRFDDPMTFLDESGRRLQLPLAHTLTASATYTPSKRDEYTADAFFSTRSQDDRYNLVYRDLNSSGSVTGISDRLSTGKGNEYSFESAFALKHSFATKGHRLSAEASLVRDGEGGPGNIATHTLDMSGNPTALTGQETSDTRERPHENYLKVDYVRPLNSKIRLETGYKGTLQNFHTTLDTWVYDTTTRIFAPDSTRISNFTFDQSIQAAYAMLSARAGKFQMQGGGRVEQAATKFFLRTLGVTYHNSYGSFFPSALVAYNVDDSHQVKLSYSTRIRRPDEPDQLDPTIHYSDPLNLSHGNPYLKPEYIRALELGLQRATDRMTILVNPYWRHTFDAVRYIRTIDTAGVTTRSPANVTTADAYGTDVTLAMSGGGRRVNGFVGGSAYKQQSNASNLAPNLSLSTFGWSARTNVTINVSRGIDAQALVNYQAAQDVEQGRNASRTRVNFAARKKLMNDRLNVTLRVNDPFSTARERSFIFDPLFYQITDRTRTIRGLVLSVNWLFGAPPKKDRDLLDEPNP